MSNDPSIMVVTSLAGLEVMAAPTLDNEGGKAVWVWRDPGEDEFLFMINGRLSKWKSLSVVNGAG